jgi:hypothetical protein
VLYGEYRKTGDEQLMRLKQKSGRACDMLTAAGLGEVYPEPGTDDDNLDEDVEAG